VPATDGSAASPSRLRAGLAVVLVRPREEGNIGAAARAMANLGIRQLLLVEPAPPLGAVARAFAVGAGAILDGAVRFPDLPAALAPFRRVVATTSGRDRALTVPLVTARELPVALAADPPGTPTALVFGPERSGLTVEELALASLLVRIPCAPEQPTLNLAQTVLLVAYELWMTSGGAAAATRPEPPATAAEQAGFLRQLRELAERTGFARDDTYAGVERDLGALLARAAPSPRELRILRGLVRRTAGALAHRRRSG
jgi:TrmH family RNA methyltransferase